MTNSEFFFVNRGMTYLVGPDWRDLFDVVICNATKPNFFSASESSRPFRELDLNGDSRKFNWTRVNSLEKGKVYTRVGQSRFCV